MAVSGVILNHRKSFSGIDVSRNCLPCDYLYRNWNYGFFKGSLYISPDTVLLYGNEGIWLSDVENSKISEFNNGIKKGADNRKICRTVSFGGKYYSAALFDLYSFNTESKRWEQVILPENIDRITDMEVKGDTLLVMTRSEILLKVAGRDFKVIEPQSSPDLHTQKSLFSILWKLHSGELFGLAGKIIVDILAILFTFLSITGILIYILPKIIKKRKKKKLPAKVYIANMKFSWKWHEKLGFWLILPLLIVVISGAFLRPPLLITIIRSKVEAPPMSTMRTDNQWHDILRTIRYDTQKQEWILYTSEGFFSMPELDKTPVKLRYQPPVSVMGLNVLEQIDSETWIVGSFNGLIIWNRLTGESIDGFTGLPFQMISRMPFGQHKISGISLSFNDKVIAFTYDDGAHVFENKGFLPMSVEYTSRPMSLWNLALEMHTGRIFTFMGMYNILFPFIVGLFSFLILLSGWWVSLRRRIKKKNILLKNGKT